MQEYKLHSFMRVADTTGKKSDWPNIYYIRYVYKGDLSNKFNSVNVGCLISLINAAVINHLMYANDLMFLAPSYMQAWH